ncbi:MAG TPA: class I SAM-dependent methyltransferase [Bryobacteraceae bacterium]|jgi:2-polyprenyl-3-methyl-5-hydroxy-6-metoxy-1,4-benzoquinol methylase
MKNMKHLSPRIRVQDFLSDFVKGKSVLDVGCVEDGALAENADTWLHKNLAKTAGSLVGIDILESDVEILRKKGYNMVCGDAMTASLGQTFDVIVLGEIIEHVVDPGALLRNMRRHLNKDGILVLTTPHPFFFFNVLITMFSKEKRFFHPDHTALFCPWTITGMLRKTGYTLEECYYFTRSRKLRSLLSILHLPVYGVIAMSMMAIAKPTASEG